MSEKINLVEVACFSFKDLHLYDVKMMHALYIYERDKIRNLSLKLEQLSYFHFCLLAAQGQLVTHTFHSIFF